MKKRGLSTIITVVILIALVLVILAVVYVIIPRIVKENNLRAQALNIMNSEIMELEKFQFDSETQDANIELVKIGGVSVPNDTIEVVIPGQAGYDIDFFSIVDISSSMVQCWYINRVCCDIITPGPTHYNAGLALCYLLPTDSATENGCITNCSFGGAGFWDNKLDAEKNANKEFIEYVFSTSDTSRVGIIAYNEFVKDSFSADLTRNEALLDSIIDSFTMNHGTCICCGINEAVERFSAQSSSDKEKVIIMMTDGVATDSCPEQLGDDPEQDALQAATDAMSSLTDLTIHTIGVGIDLDSQMLQDIADIGHGNYYSTTDLNQLQELYLGIVEETIITMQQSTTRQFIHYLSFVFYNATDSYEERTTELPEILAPKKYSFNLQGKISGVTKVEVYPIIIMESGKEIIGSMLDSREIEDSTDSIEY
jgi:hypothetical protein